MAWFVYIGNRVVDCVVYGTTYVGNRRVEVFTTLSAYKCGVSCVFVGNWIDIFFVFCKLKILYVERADSPVAISFRISTNK